MGSANSTVWRADAGTPERERYEVAMEMLRIRYSGAIFVRVIRAARKGFGDPARLQSGSSSGPARG